jgi:hypothetical protein
MLFLLLFLSHVSAIPVISQITTLTSHSYSTFVFLLSVFKQGTCFIEKLCNIKDLIMQQNIEPCGM